jgi:hypothetical protein
MPTLLLALLLGFADDSIRFSEPEIHLWPIEGQTEPETWNPSKDGFHRVTNIHNPSITAFLPPKDKANGAAFIVCPGGGHQYLVMDLEGSLVAKKLNDMGVAAFILKSRLSRAPGSTYKTDVESLADAQRAIRLVRSRSKESIRRGSASWDSPPVASSPRSPKHAFNRPTQMPRIRSTASVPAPIS